MSPKQVHATPGMPRRGAHGPALHHGRLRLRRRGREAGARLYLSLSLCLSLSLSLSLYIYIYMYIFICIYIYICKVALIAQWLGCQPHEAEVLGSILTTSN